MNTNRLSFLSMDRLGTVLKHSPSDLRAIAERTGTLYGSFLRPKEDGTFREINPPREPLKSIQGALKVVLNRSLIWGECVHGGISGRSIISNAKVHVGRQMVVTLDIRKFFPNCRPEMVRAALTRTGCGESVAILLTRLCTFRAGLPQGSPTSTALGNLILEPLDAQFTGLSRRHGLNYTRYVDDLTISGDRDLFSFRQTFQNYIETSGFEISPHKFSFRPRGQRQIVTGLVVNDRLRPTREFIMSFKSSAKRCWPESDGLEVVAMEEGLEASELYQSLWGRLQYLKHVDRSLGMRFHGILARIPKPGKQGKNRHPLLNPTSPRPILQRAS